MDFQVARSLMRANLPTSVGRAAGFGFVADFLLLVVARFIGRLRADAVAGMGEPDAAGGGAANAPGASATAALGQLEFVKAFVELLENRNGARSW